MAFPLIFTEDRTLTSRFTLFLYDGFSRRNFLDGTVEVQIAGQPAPYAKPGEATWIFYSLPDGAYSVTVAPDVDTPYYQPVTIPVNLPVPNALWPAFPDRTLADPTLMLDDPAQTVAYRAQRALATLRPTASYPFPQGTTLVRGTVRAGGVALPDATVFVDGQPQLSYVTASDGQFVIFFDQPQGMAQNLNLRAQHASKPDVLTPVTVQRGLSVKVDITMAP
jgi:hypothetical protein